MVYIACKDRILIVRMENVLILAYKLWRFVPTTRRLQRLDGYCILMRRAFAAFSRCFYRQLLVLLHTGILVFDIKRSMYNSLEFAQRQRLP